MNDDLIASMGPGEAETGEGMTVLIAHYNLGRYVDDCLHSLVGQTDPRWKCIILDDASTDGSRGLLQNHALLLADSRFRLLLGDENQGYIRTLRRLIDAADTDIVGLLDADDALTPDAVEQILAAYRRLDTGFIYSNFHACDAQLRPVMLGFCRELRHGESLIDANCASHFKTFRRSAYQQTEGIDDAIMYAEDKDLVYKLEEVTRPYFLDAPLYYYRTGRNDSQSAGEKAAVGRRNMQVAIEKAKRRREKKTFAGIDLGSADCTNRIAPSPCGAIHLSLCMIVRDNERILQPCLASIRPWVDELIVVDTGSKDQTSEIARRHGAQVHHFPWCDDFARARNESLNRARGEWVFWMDSDDTIDAANGRKLRELARGPHDDKTLGYVMQVHCPGNDATDVTVVDHVKMFRNLPQLRFEGRIHEQILPAVRRMNGEVVFTDIFVVHSGSDRTEEGRQGKLRRDLHLLRLELQDHPDHPFALFNLGMTLADAGEHGQSVDALARSLLVASPSDSHVRKAYALAVSSLMQLGRPSAAAEACRKGRELFPDDAELLFREGMLAHQLGRLADAERAYLGALADRDGRHFASKDRAIGGFKARHNLALVYMDMGAADKAQAQWQAVLEEARSFVPAWRGLTDALSRQGNAAELERLAAELAGDVRMQLERLLVLAAAHRCCGEFSRAREVLEEAARLPSADRIALHQLCRLLFEHGAPVDAEAALLRLTQLDPSDGAAFYNLGAVYVRMEHYRAAIQAFEESLRLRPASLQTMLALAEARSKVGDVATALEVLHRAKGLKPDDASIQAAIARFESTASA